MPSSLKNLKFFENMNWSTFGQPVLKPAPLPGGRASGAETIVKWKFDVAPTAARVQGSKEWTLADSVVVNIKFNPAKSWVAKWVFEPSRKDFAEKLLHHEIGHYKMCAFIARDMFIELMQLKSKTFKTQPELGAAINKITAKHHNDSVIRGIHETYDKKTESDHGLNSAGQNTWDGYFDKAFTTARTSGELAPDGKAYKMPLLEILSAAGKL